MKISKLLLFTNYFLWSTQLFVPKHFILLHKKKDWDNSSGLQYWPWDFFNVFKILLMRIEQLSKVLSIVQFLRMVQTLPGDETVINYTGHKQLRVSSSSGIIALENLYLYRRLSLGLKSSEDEDQLSTWIFKNHRIDS